MKFSDFSAVIHARFNELAATQLYKVDVSKADIWNAYLDSFPAGTNEIYKERREHDCQCCAQFVKNIGNLVAIVDGKFTSVWDVNVGGHFQVVCDALASLVSSAQIVNVFMHTERKFGQQTTTQVTEEGQSINWNHFHCELPSSYVSNNCRTILGKHQTNSKVIKRSLDEISQESCEIVIDLINQKSLYKGDEFKGLVQEFDALKSIYVAYENNSRAKDILVWQNIESHAAKIRSTVIGTLLVDISEGMDINAAVGSFESKVAPTNYKRSSAPITKAMINKAMEKIESLGIRESLDRRFAAVEDVSVNNVLFVDRSVSPAMKDSLVDDLMSEARSSSKSYDGIGEVSIDEFIQDILPNIDSMEVEVKNHHESNMVSLIGPKSDDAENIFQWDNGFSWSYSGNITDSIKERVKRAGGNVDGVLRASLGWFNGDDLDIHLVEPDGNLISFSKMRSSNTHGKLDVDMNAGGARNSVNPVENIVYPDLGRMPDGDYQVVVHNYAKRSSSNVGFEIEIAFEGHSSLYSYDKAVANNEKVRVVTINKKGNSFSISKIGNGIDAEGKSKEIWGVSTENFQKVSLMCLSPNYWDDQSCGNKHYMFMLDSCSNPEPARGVYNEFLRSDLHEHRKVLELVGEKTKCQPSDNQLSGLGFSSTQRASIVCKVSGNFNRTIKVNF